MAFEVETVVGKLISCCQGASLLGCRDACCRMVVYVLRFIMRQYVYSSPVSLGFAFWTFYHFESIVLKDLFHLLERQCDRGKEEVSCIHCFPQMARNVGAEPHEARSLALHLGLLHGAEAHAPGLSSAALPGLLAGAEAEAEQHPPAVLIIGRDSPLRSSIGP